MVVQVVDILKRKVGDKIEIRRDPIRRDPDLNAALSVVSGQIVQDDRCF